MRARVEARERADAEGRAGGAPSNVDRATPPLYTRLEGLPADRTLLAGAAPPEGARSASSRPLPPAELARASRVAEIAVLAGRLSDDDQRVVIAILKELPTEVLLAKCRWIKEAGRGPALNADGSLPRNDLTADGHEHDRATLAGLLGTVRDYQRQLGLPVVGRR